MTRACERSSRRRSRTRPGCGGTCTRGAAMRCRTTPRGCPAATALATAGHRLGCRHWIDAAFGAPQHAIAVSDESGRSDLGLRSLYAILGSSRNDPDPYTWNRCHGPAGTSYLFQEEVRRPSRPVAPVPRVRVEVVPLEPRDHVGGAEPQVAASRLVRHCDDVLGPCNAASIQSWRPSR